MRDDYCARFARFLGHYVIGPLFVVPILILFAPIYRWRQARIYHWNPEQHVTTAEQHRKKVTSVQKQVRAWNTDGRTRKMCTARKPWDQISLLKVDKRDLAQIDLSALNCLVEVDEVNGWLTAEPGLNMGQLTAILEGRGWAWTIPVLPEVEFLTVGGTIAGAGIESGSIHYGLMADSALEYEVVVSSGEVVRCSRDENSDLFHAIPWSHGTIGFLVSVKFPIIRAGTYVKLQYNVANNLDEAQRLLESQDHTFVEGIAYGPRKFVVMHGDMVDEPEGAGGGSVNHINRWYKPFFYQHVGSMLTKPGHVEYIPTRDYYHRHSRGAFWVFPLLFPILGTRPFLTLFGWIFPSYDNVMQRLALPFLQSGAYGVIQSMMNIGQDYVIPMKHFQAAVDYYHSEVGSYPTWLCPAKLVNSPGASHCSAGNDSELYVDIGLYGNASKEARPGFHPQHTLKKLEAYCIEKGGYMGTYAEMFLSREQWAQMFDMRLYEEVRTKYDCQDAFPNVYDKVIKNAIRPV